MRRAVMTLGGTAVGLAALLSYKTHSGAAVVSAVGTPGTSTATSAATAPADAGPASTGPASNGSAPAATATPSASAKAAGHADSASARTITGTVANTQYGPMQVQVTLVGQKITKVTVLQRTDDGSESNEIDSMAIPQLTSETLAAQSARIDAVSGASYTSSGYIQSLQSALDKATA